jgi:hypothetical protein
MLLAGFIFWVPSLSLVIVLLALFIMKPQHKLFWLWRSACLVAAFPPLLVILGALRSDEQLVPGFAALSAVVSAPLAAALSVAVAVRLRRAA